MDKKMKNVAKVERSRRVFNKDMYLILPFFSEFFKVSLSSSYCILKWVPVSLE